eukprot:scaffold41905_cov54-Phaeocystis_antarctica.AAC.1
MEAAQSDAADSATELLDDSLIELITALSLFVGAVRSAATARGAGCGARSESSCATTPSSCQLTRESSAREFSERVHPTIQPPSISGSDQAPAVPAKGAPLTLRRNEVKQAATNWLESTAARSEATAATEEQHLR